MLFGEYLNNPYGTGSSVSPVSMIKQNASMELRQLGKIEHKVYSTRNNQLIFACRLPSRKKQMGYDVVIQIDLNEAEKSRLSIARFPFKVFSNSPSFYYTYAKAFQEHGMLCEWLRRKYDRKVMRKDSNSRNPSKIIGYERSIYLCMHYLNETYRSTPAWQIFEKAELVGYQWIVNRISSQDDVEYAYDVADDTPEEMQRKEEVAARKRERELNKQKKADEKREKVKAGQRAPKSATSKTSKTVNTTKTTKSAKTVRSSKTKKAHKM